MSIGQFEGIEHSSNTGIAITSLASRAAAARK
jgi:hypothetical protein